MNDSGYKSGNSNDNNGPNDQLSNGNGRQNASAAASSYTDDHYYKTESGAGGNRSTSSDDSPKPQDKKSGGGGASRGGGGTAAGSGGFVVAESANVCRDFLNNVCFRGDACKYDHPKTVRQETTVREDIKFCNDFQYGGCFRSSCQLVHCMRADVLAYEETGRISEPLARAVVAATGQRSGGGRPLCKEFMTGQCSRGYRCRFWHIDPEEEMRVRQKTQDAASDRHYREMQLERNPMLAYSQRGGVPAPDYDGYGGPGSDLGRHDYKRARYDEVSDQPVDPRRSRPAADLSSSSSMTASSPLVEENAILRRKIDMLKQTLSDMQAANEALLSENTRLRSKAVSNANAAVAAANMSSATAALNGVLNNPAAGLSQLASAQPASATSCLTPEQHMAVVSIAAAAAAAQHSTQAMVVHPSLAYNTVSSDGLQWSLAQMHR